MSAPILVVDDSLTVRMDLTEALEAAGLRALPCASAAEARAALERDGASLVLLDVVLPDADGVELLKEIRTKLGRSIPVLMLSSEAEVKDRVRALQTGADDYVGKPYDIGYVVARVRELLRDRAADTHGHSAAITATVLVIDDSQTFREELRHVLEHAGYAVVTAASGEEGVRVAANIRPTAIIVDGVLPGIDGAGVIRKVRLDSALRGTPCVLLTGSEGIDSELRALDAGADAFVRKEESTEVILARLRAVLRSATSPSAATSSLLGPKRILAVDDSATYRHELAAVLRGEGYEVVPASTGEEALEMISAQQVDCVILDLIMPGMGGEETCRRIKGSPVLRDIPLILLTASEDRATMLQGLGAGADDYIAKSSDFDVLRARIRAQLRRKQFEDEHRRIRDELLRSELLAKEEGMARKVAEARAAVAEELARKNEELEAFSYSVSHDLRAPLRSIGGFSRAVLTDYGDVLDPVGRDYLLRVEAGVHRMTEIIDDLLQLSGVGSATFVRAPTDVGAAARSVIDELRRRDPSREVEVILQEPLLADADARLVRILLENLLGNAWKFTGKTAQPQISLGVERRGSEDVHVVRDNGAGFDPSFASKLFRPFQRLHTQDEFPGTGIGLATTRRVVDRHGGRIWAEGAVGVGTSVFFTLKQAPV